MFVMDQTVVLTLFDGQVSHCEGHGMPREDVISAVDVVPVDTEAPARWYGDDSPHVVCNDIRLVSDW